MSLSFLQWIAAGMLSLIVIYIVARLIFAAWFLTKQQHEAKRKMKHE